MSMALMAVKIVRELDSQGAPNLEYVAVAVSVMESFVRSSRNLPLSSGAQEELDLIKKCGQALWQRVLNPLADYPGMAAELADEHYLPALQQLRESCLLFPFLPADQRTAAIRELKQLSRCLRFDMGRPELIPNTAVFYAETLEEFVRATEKLALAPDDLRERVFLADRARLVRERLELDPDED